MTDTLSCNNAAVVKNLIDRGDDDRKSNLTLAKVFPRKKGGSILKIEPKLNEDLTRAGLEGGTRGRDTRGGTRGRIEVCCKLIVNVGLAGGL